MHLYPRNGARVKWAQVSSHQSFNRFSSSVQSRRTGISVRASSCRGATIMRRNRDSGLRVAGGGGARSGVFGGVDQDAPRAARNECGETHIG